MFHRAKFTVRNVVPCQIGFSFVVCSIAKFLYIVGVVTFDCKPSFYDRMLLNTTLALLVVPCVILKITIFIRTQDITLRSTIYPNTNERVEDINHLNSDNINSSRESAPSIRANAEIRVHATEETIGKWDRESMKALMFCVLSLLILYVPRILFEFSTFVCSKLIPFQKEMCNFVEARTFFIEFTSLHGVIQPLIFLWFCDQFWTAWNNRAN